MKTLALVPWDISQPETGGTQRCYQLLTAIPDLTTFALTWDPTQEQHRKLNNMNYRVIYAGNDAMDRAQKLFRQGLTSYDPIPRIVHDDLHAIREAIDNYDPDLIILEHPWLIDLTDGRPFVYDAHNCESIITAHRAGRNSLDYDIVNGLERDAILEAEHVTYCSDHDWKVIRNTWPHAPEGTHIPNGANLPRKQTNNTNRNLIFIGSVYYPNVVAAQKLADIAHQLPEYHIHLVGASSLGVETSATNVTQHGHITDNQLHDLLLDAHIFVNLIETGSGTHLKIPQALAYGIPVLSSTVGARGYRGDVNICDDLHDAPELIRYITNNWDAQHKHARRAAYKYDWENIRHNFCKVINALQ